MPDELESGSQEIRNGASGTSDISAPLRSAPLQFAIGFKLLLLCEQAHREARWPLLCRMLTNSVKYVFRNVLRAVRSQLLKRALLLLNTECEHAIVVPPLFLTMLFDNCICIRVIVASNTPASGNLEHLKAFRPDSGPRSIAASAVGANNGRRCRSAPQRAPSSNKTYADSTLVAEIKPINASHSRMSFRRAASVSAPPVSR